MATTTSTKNASGKVTSPAAFGAIATLAAPPAGQYRVLVWVGLGGTLAAADAGNVQIVAPTDFSLTLGSVPAAAGHYGPFEMVWQADGVNTLSVTAGSGTPTTGSVYQATVLAEPTATGKLVSL